VPRQLNTIQQRKEPSQKGTKKETALPNPQSLPRRSFPRGRRLPLPPERLQRFTFELAGKNCSNGSSTQGGGAVGHARKAARSAGEQQRWRTLELAKIVMMAAASEGNREGDLRAGK
jgi:hypothetical protein